MAVDPSDLTTVAFVQQLANVTGDDDLIQSLITAISAYVPSILNQGVLQAQYTEIRQGNGKGRMMLANWPVQSVDLVEWTGNSQAVQADVISGQPGITSDGKAALLVGSCFPQGAPVRITYTAGYAEVPFDIALAVAEIVSETYTRRAHAGLNSTSVGGQVTSSYEMKAMHAAIAAKLSHYIRVAPL